MGLRSAGVFNMGVGGESSTQIKNRMVADTAKHGLYTIIWAGRNNSFAPATVKADIAAMIAALTMTPKKYVVLSILNGTAEPRGSAAYNDIVGINNDLAVLYPDNYLDVRSHLVSLYDPGNPTDVQNFADDVPPSTLRSDAVHLNTAGYTAVANFVNAYLATHP